MEAITTLPPKITVNRQIGYFVIVAAAETPGHWIAQCQHPQCSNRRPKREYGEEVLLSATVSTCGCKYTANADFPEYNTWKQARARCRNLRHEHYPDYGGRGIRFDERWDDFKVFFRDMGPRPTKLYQLHRTDNDGHYSPGNCKWTMPAGHLGPGMRRAPRSAPTSPTVVATPIDDKLEGKVKDMIRKEQLKAEIVGRVMSKTPPEQLHAEMEAEAEVQAQLKEAEAEFQAEQQAKRQRKRKAKYFGVSPEQRLRIERWR